MAEKSVEEKIVKAKMPWLLVIVFSAVVSSIVTITQAFTQPISVARSVYTLGIAPCAIDFPMASFALLFMLPLLRKIEFLRKRIDMELMTYLYVAAVCVSWTCNQLYCTEIGPYFADRIAYPEDTLEYIPLVVAPPTSAIEAWLRGSVPVPWGDWIPVILWHWIRHISIVLLMVSFSGIIRRSWIDIERIPFPHSIAAYELAVVSMSGRQKLLQSKTLLIGILLGIVFQVPIFFTYIFPWFPDIYGWKVNTCGTGAWAMPPGHSLAVIIGLSCIQKNPVTFAIMFLTPLRVLFSTWVWTFIYFIAIQVAWYQGYYTGLENYGGCCRGYFSPSPLWVPPFKFMALSFSGGFTALAVIYLYLNRDYLWQTIKVALGKLDPSVVRELEKNEPLTYRQMWLLFVAGFVLNMIVYATAGVSAYPTFVMIAGLLILWIGMARVAGLTGINSTESVDHGNTFLRLFVWPTAPEPPTRDFMLTSAAAQWASQPYAPPYGFSIISSFASFRFASLTGADNRNVFKTIVIALSVGFLFSFITMISLNYQFGATRLSLLFPMTTEFRDRTGSPEVWNSRPGTEPLAPYMFAGFAVTSILYVLSARLLWFPLEPVGFIVGTSMLGAGLIGLWMPALVCWIAKTLVLRIGGSKLYEEHAVPFVSGFIGGYTLITVVAAIVFVVRFFYPF
ncbi:hypothetical protein KEJ27_08560 [Candidatus Bathyarchaeota archaeon]|nr:hypothetical protein [Candidatus Bathyarchaeota archaeon]